MPNFPFFQSAPETPVMIECGNCEVDFPQGSGTHGDLFCSDHCRQQNYGDLCNGDCPACEVARKQN